MGTNTNTNEHYQNAKTISLQISYPINKDKSKSLLKVSGRYSNMANLLKPNKARGKNYSLYTHMFLTLMKAQGTRYP